MIRACPVCDSTNLTPFFEALRAPVHCCRLWDTAEAALAAPRGDIGLAVCGSCGMIFNQRFDALLIQYDGGYENATHFSPHFQLFAEALADRLIARHDLRGKHLLEIGCGDAHFLRLLCERSGSRGTGFDPSYQLDGSASGAVRIVNEPFSLGSAGTTFDFACSRHVLEHMQDPWAFVREVRLALGDRAGVPVYFEVPSADKILHDQDVWEVIYEHFGYFTRSLLRRLFAACGFEVLDVYEHYDGQFLAIEAVTAVEQPLQQLSGDARDDLLESAAVFRSDYAAPARETQLMLDRLQREGRQAVLWGAGSRGVAFLNAISGADTIAGVVDISPRKHGKFIPGTGQEILAPEAVPALKPDVVLLTNRVYEDEVRRQLAALGVHPDIVVEGAHFAAAV